MKKILIYLIPLLLVFLALGAKTSTSIPSAKPFTSQTITSVDFYISPSGKDSNDGRAESSPFLTIQKAVDLAKPGDTISLAPGTYYQDVVTKRSGSSDAPITIIGSKDAVVKGGGNDRIFEINHNYINLNGFTIDGQFENHNQASSFRDKLIYILGEKPQSGVTGLKILNMTIQNSGGECVRLRYFAQKNEIAFSNIQNCGVYDFKFNDKGKNGEGIYIGTAPEQLKDGKNPTTDIDQSNDNWIHDNNINTEGNECVDIKEGSSGNIVENNTCTGQKDPESGGLDARGSNNTFRNNEIFGNLGAGVRLGGDTITDGINNNVYNNTIRNNNSGGIKFERWPQGNVCNNTMSGNIKGDIVGSLKVLFKPVQNCY